jgi:hypothetical protein
MIASSCASTRQPSKPLDSQNNETAVADKKDESDIGSIARELRAIRDQAAEAERNRATQKEPGGPPVWSNWVLIIVAAGAGVIGYMTLRPIRPEADSTAEMMRVSHRPRIKIRNVVVPQLADMYPPTELKGKCWITNYGASNAVLARIFVDWVFDPLPMENPATIETMGIQEVTIEPGQITPLPLPVRSISDDDHYMISIGKKSINLVGVVKYWNKDKTTMYRTFFCRRYNPSTKRFSPIQDDDYEYEE